MLVFFLQTQVFRRLSVSLITMPAKGKLLLTAGCASFRTERKFVAAASEGIVEDTFALVPELNQRPNNLHEQFAILKKCRGKFECIIYEMFLIRKKRPI